MKCLPIHTKNVLRKYTNLIYRQTFYRYFLDVKVNSSKSTSNTYRTLTSVKTV